MTVAGSPGRHWCRQGPVKSRLAHMLVPVAVLFCLDGCCAASMLRGLGASGSHRGLQAAACMLDDEPTP